MSPAHSRALTFCQRFGLRIPILQAPMAGAAPPALAAAVANAGGLGGFGALMSGPAQIHDWAKAFRAQSNGGFQVNLWIPDPPPQRDPAHEDRVRARLSVLSGTTLAEPGPGPFLADFADQCAAMLEVAPPVVSSIMGVFPPELVAQLKARGILWIANATTVAEARLAEAAGADAVVAQGAEAGGHRGTFDDRAAESASMNGLFALLPQIADAVRVPVVAAGGIMDGRGIAAALILGASAVQLGTAFLRCPETAIHPAWAAALGHARPEDTVLTRGFSGRLARGLRNQVTEAFAGELRPAPYPVQRAMMAPVRAAAEARGDVSCMQAWAGQGAALSSAEPATALTTRLWAEAEALLG